MRSCESCRGLCVGVKSWVMRGVVTHVVVEFRRQ